jgi:hypothetical protein
MTPTGFLNFVVYNSAAIRAEQTEQNQIRRSFHSIIRLADSLKMYLPVSLKWQICWINFQHKIPFYP